MPRRIDKTAVFLPYYPAEYRAEDENAGKSPENPFFDRYKTNRSKFNHTAAARDISEGREKSYVWMLRVQSCARCGGNGMLKTVWKSEKKTRAQTEGIDVLIYLRIKSVWWGRGDTRRISNKERRTWNKPFVPLFHRVCQSRWESFFPSAFESWNRWDTYCKGYFNPLSFIIIYIYSFRNIVREETG